MVNYEWNAGVNDFLIAGQNEMFGNIGSEIIELIKRPGTALQVSGQKGLLSTDSKSENNWRVCQTSGKRPSFLFFLLISKSIV